MMRPVKLLRITAWTACLLLALAASAEESAEPTDELCAEVLLRSGVELRVEPIQGGEPTKTEQDAQHIPGFEIRGFAGAVRKEVVLCPLLSMSLQALPAEEGKPELLRVLLANRSDDLVTVKSIQPALGTAGLPWAGGLTLPLELDLEATVLLLEAPPAGYPAVTPLELAIVTEDGYRQVWRLESRKVEAVPEVAGDTGSADQERAAPASPLR